ncbi:hypothetical protein AAF712_009124 [Marasmius tenuissimus]|uniref:Uncharacterized protein n=1 Tax=Marasmius tenuissimus TaxID=585030 RepID=A0ABR2ZRY7_9AGAR
MDLVCRSFSFRKLLWKKGREDTETIHEEFPVDPIPAASATVVTPQQVVDQLMLTPDDKEPMEINFSATVQHIAQQVYGFTGDDFQVPRPLTVDWNIAQEALRNGRWFDNPLNNVFVEETLFDSVMDNLWGFLQNIRDHPVPLPWTPPSIIPALDLHQPSSLVCTQSSWKFQVRIKDLSDGQHYHLQWDGVSLSILVQDPIAVLRLVRTNSATAYTDAASALYREGVQFQTLVQGPPIQHDIEDSGVVDEDDAAIRGGDGLKGPRLGFIYPDYKADAYDFFTYESARNQFLRGGKGRIAATAGGVIGQVAKEVVNEEDLLIGSQVPEVFCEGKCYFQEGDVGYWDDYMTEEDVDLLCGVYYFWTGRALITLVLHQILIQYRQDPGLRQ